MARDPKDEVLSAMSVELLDIGAARDLSVSHVDDLL